MVSFSCLNLRHAVLAAVVCALLPGAAMALPGHTLPQEKYWANHNEFLLELEESKLDNQKVYLTQRKTSNGTVIYFIVYINPKLQDVVLSESLWLIPTEKSLPLDQRFDYFMKSHKKMFEAFFMTIYNSIVIRDDYLAAESDLQPDTKSPRAFYRGRKYGYMLEYSPENLPSCKDKCTKGAFQLNIYDINTYEVKVTAERNRKKEQPVNINIFP